MCLGQLNPVRRASQHLRGAVRGRKVTSTRTGILLSLSVSYTVTWANIVLKPCFFCDLVGWKCSRLPCWKLSKWPGLSLWRCLSFWLTLIKARMRSLTRMRLIYCWNACRTTTRSWYRRMWFSLSERSNGGIFNLFEKQLLILNTYLLHTQKNTQINCVSINDWMTLFVNTTI